jgi:transmembrane sensor
MWQKAAAIAACFIIMIAVGTWWRYAPTTYETGTGERRVIALADGSSLSLDAATRVDVRYLGDRRQLWLQRGRAKFTVAKDALRPFSVEAGSRMVVATGTQFSVERLAKEVRVVLYEGHVAVMDVSQPQPRTLAAGPGSIAAERALAPAHQLIIPDQEPSLPLTGPFASRDPASTARIVSIDPGRSVAWEGGLLEFANEPLNSAIERMNRYGTRVLSVDAAAGQTIMISGQFEGSNTDAFVEGVTSLFPLEAVRRPDGVIELRSAPHKN